MATAGIGRLRRPAFDARASVELAKLGLPFFPPTRFALAPSALLTVVNDILLNRRAVAVELGAGVSSLYMAHALARHDGKMVSVDADADWLALVKEMAHEAGVADRIVTVHAPLKPMHDGVAWYDMDAIKGALGGAQIDLLLVDGPVASGKERNRARAPAGPALAPILAPRCAVFLDDIHRPSHARIAREWESVLDLRFSLHHARGGFAYGVRGGGFDPII